MRSSLTILLPTLALIGLWACGNKTETRPDASADGAATVEDGAVSDGGSQDVASGSDASDVLAQADATSGDANLILTVDWSGQAGILIVGAMPDGSMGGDEPGAGGMVEVFSGPIKAFPTTLDLKMPGGLWMIGIQLITDPDDEDSVIAEATVCVGGKVAATQVPAPGKGSVKLKMKLHTLAEARGKICMADDMVLTKGVAIQQAAVEPPVPRHNSVGPRNQALEPSNL